MKKQCLIIFGLAFILRLCLQIPVFTSEERSFGFGADSECYEKLALRMIEYGGYSVYPDTSYIPEPARPPGYPILIFSFYKLFGQRPLFIILFQALLDSIVAVLIFIALASISVAPRFILGKQSRVDGGPLTTIPFIGGLIYALNVHQALYTTQLLSETLFTFFLFLSIFLLLQTIVILNPERRQGRSGPLTRLFYSSILIGMATYIRPIAIYFPVFIGGWLILSRYGGNINKIRRSSLLETGRSGPLTRPIINVIRHSAFSISLLYLLIFISVLTPWIIRNYKCFGAPFFSIMGDINLAFYNAAPVLARTENISEEKARDQIFQILKDKYKLTDKELTLYSDDPKISNLLRKEGLAIIKRHPVIYGQEHLLGFAKVFIHSEFAYWARLFYGYDKETLKSMPSVSKPALRLVLTGKISSAWRLVLRERIKVLPAGLIVLWLFTSIYELIVYILGVRGAIFLFRNCRHEFPATSRKPFPKESRFHRNGAGKGGDNSCKLWLVLIILTIFYFAFIPGPIGDGRFRVPIEPFLAILAGLGVYNTNLLTR